MGMRGRVLIVAGSDSGGGAGIQADIKTVTMLGGYAATAITALTAQNTLGVHGIQEVPVPFIERQMEAVLGDIGADAVKTGMLHRAEVIEAVCAMLDSHAAGVPLVVDPVMVAKGGAPLLEKSAIDALKAELILRATVLTPNLPEAELLSGRRIQDPEDMGKVGRMLLTLGPRAVLMKGGHLPGEQVTDILVTGSEFHAFTSARVDSRHTHGTGCTLASAIAVGLAQGMPVKDAVRRARLYVQEAIRRAPGLGSGHGPLDHGHPLADKASRIG
ncbi:MAG: bifunctional hydroxymethylpyrimidine kinase/phosphomethylpyrimidine kinase [Thalassobaculales bacterium]